MYLKFEDLKKWRLQVGKEGGRVVATNGCFDILHVGHIRYLQGARSLGDHLVVGLNSDLSVQKLKGPQRPINKQDDRAEVLLALQCVDWVCIFEQPTATEFLVAAQPHIYVKGGDYTIEQLNKDEVQAVRDCGGQIIILPLVPGKSTTNIIQTAQLNHG